MNRDGCRLGKELEVVLGHKWGVGAEPHMVVWGLCPRSRSFNAFCVLIKAFS